MPDEVRDAGGAEEALRFFEADSDIALLFTDVSVPGSMNGADLLARQVAARWPGVGTHPGDRPGRALTPHFRRAARLA